MLKLALLFLGLAVIAFVLGATGVASVATNIAWVLGVIFVILLVVGLVTGRKTV